MDKIQVTNIQRFSLHDSPGIRTTVFFNGCSLHCPWCSNPETIYPCIQNSVLSNNKIAGRIMTAEDIYTEVTKDRAFYSNDGGVTYSGGEPLLRIKSLEPLITKLSAEGIHQSIETNLFVPQENIELASKKWNFFTLI